MTLIKPRKRILLIFEMSRAHGRGIMEGISMYASQNTNWILNFESRSILEQKPNWLKNWMGDGIISRSASLAIEQAILAKNVPVVELFRSVPGDVESDGFLVGKMAANYLLQRGFRNYAFYAPLNIWWIDWRCQGYVDTLKEHGFSCMVFPKFRRKTRLLLPFWEEQFLDELITWLKILPRPCCIYCPTDILVSRVLDACITTDIHVPEEIAVLGTDNDTLICNLVTPKLSSFGLNSCQLGYEAAALLDMKMSGKTLPKLPILVPPLEVQTRQSTDIIATPDEDVADAIRYIRENAIYGLTVADVVDKMSMSQRNLQRRFQKWLGHSLDDEIISTRLKMAKMFLLDTEHTIDTIAKRTGFKTSHYFIRLFKKRFNLTPKQYRLLHRTGHYDDVNTD